MVTIFIGIVLGLLLGSIPFFVPGMSYPLRLGLAGGPIVMGIFIGAFGPRLHMVAYTTTNLWRLALASAQHSSPHTPEHAPAASAARHLGPERTLAPSCGHLL